MSRLISRVRKYVSGDQSIPDSNSLNSGSDNDEDFNDARSITSDKVIRLPQPSISDDESEASTERGLNREPMIQDEDDQRPEITKEEAENITNKEKKKVEVAPNVLKRTMHSGIMPSKIWTGQKLYQHMGLVGATGSGKTHRFLTFLADQKIPICDKYYIVGDSPSRDDLIKGICSLHYLSSIPYSSAKIVHYPISDVSKVISMCLDEANNHFTKYIFFNDVLISNAKNRDLLANFVNKAKNFKTTCCIEIHHLAGPNMLLLRRALFHKVYCDVPPKSLKLELADSSDDSLLIKYSGLPIRDRVVINDRELGNFNKNYTPF